MDAERFATLLRQARAGDALAAEALVREYEPAIRRYVRVRLTDARLRRVLDTMDVCQSVLANFFVRIAAGQFDLERPEQLIALLVAMAHNRLLNHVSHEQAARRDHRRHVDAELGQTVDSAPSPSRIVAGRELLELLESRLQPDERELFLRRKAGQEWGEIAAELGGTPEALRKRLHRALDRVGATMGMEQVTGDLAY